MYWNCKKGDYLRANGIDWWARKSGRVRVVIIFYYFEALGEAKGSATLINPCGPACQRKEPDLAVTSDSFL